MYVYCNNKNIEYIECWYYSNYRCMYVYCNNNNIE